MEDGWNNKERTNVSMNREASLFREKPAGQGVKAA
jgi:hypothetical protein